MGLCLGAPHNVHGIQVSPFAAGLRDTDFSFLFNASLGLLKPFYNKYDLFMLLYFGSGNFTQDLIHIKYTLPLSYTLRSFLYLEKMLGRNSLLKDPVYTYQR